LILKKAAALSKTGLLFVDLGGKPERKFRT
jgi:hypothetical protein